MTKTTKSITIIAVILFVMWFVNTFFLEVREEGRKDISQQQFFMEGNDHFIKINDYDLKISDENFKKINLNDNSSYKLSFTYNKLFKSGQIEKVIKYE
ncbi:hypothetical protein [Kurthia sibirica]|uniref:Uncharacterized protein n=1 Tax=Kurthia sibirica TaxID=202750 RepID=A0A2U3AHW1_9BACL|nr:hypothetical protein [Kurthia sibirica]PWI24139.1 hypothetical protein DEX24_15265 [Kurthia sibirica]GEK35491.1 hypothetical protein KSI01_30240 [Kurthia sibirica]